jgi:hypothetical protein
MELNKFKVLSHNEQYDILRTTLHNLNYLFFETGLYDINIIEIRNTADRNSDKFNDLVAVAYLDRSSNRVVDLYEATTDPSSVYRLKPINKNGVAIVLPQQSVGGLTIGLHKGYSALVQNRGLYVLRDNDKNADLNTLGFYTMEEMSKFDKESALYELKKHSVIEFGYYGLNHHRASKWNILESVGLYSAGCIVHKDPNKFNEFMNLINKSAKIYGNLFTRTLIISDNL